MILVTLYIFVNMADARRLKFGKRSSEYMRVIKLHRLAIPIFSALVGSQSIIFAKSIAELLKMTSKGNNQFAFWETYILIVAMICTIFTQIHWLAKALKYFDASFVIPLFQASFITFASFGGGIYFREFDSFQTNQVIGFPISIFLVGFGVALLSLREVTPTDDKVELLDADAAEGALHDVMAEIDKGGGGGGGGGGRLAPITELENGMERGNENKGHFNAADPHDENENSLDQTMETVSSITSSPASYSELKNSTNSKHSQRHSIPNSTTKEHPVTNTPPHLRLIRGGPKAGRALPSTPKAWIEDGVKNGGNGLSILYAAREIKRHLGGRRSRRRGVGPSSYSRPKSNGKGGKYRPTSASSVGSWQSNNDHISVSSINSFELDSSGREDGSPSPNGSGVGGGGERNEESGSGDGNGNGRSSPSSPSSSSSRIRASTAAREAALQDKLLNSMNAAMMDHTGSNRQPHQSNRKKKAELTISTNTTSKAKRSSSGAASSGRKINTGTLGTTGTAAGQKHKNVMPSPGSSSNIYLGRPTSAERARLCLAQQRRDMVNSRANGVSKVEENKVEDDYDPCAETFDGDTELMNRRLEFKTATTPTNSIRKGLLPRT